MSFKEKKALDIFHGERGGMSLDTQNNVGALNNPFRLSPYVDCLSK